ncbi:hypothetical protein [Novosphingobium sp. SG707]|nr:hypothetical protein [Novosphingobium sp. SG707]NKJ02784.1 hypothetical protein [Novosphingobium sp. SG707]
MSMPKAAAAIATVSLLFTTALLAIDRVIAGAVQCGALSCLNA